LEVSIMRRSSRALVLAAFLLLAAGSYTAFAETAAASTTVDLSFTEPTSAADIYRAVGKAFGIRVMFDPKLRASILTLELEDVTAVQAFRLLDASTGHFTAVLDDGAVIVADDTPQNRYTYENQVLRTFHLENLDLKDAMTLLRSILGAKALTASESTNGLVMRDTSAKVRVAERLLAVVDKPRGEVAVDVEVLYLEGEASQRRSEDYRMSGDELASLRRSARRLTSQELSVLENDSGKWALKDSLDFPGDGETTHVNVGFELEVRPRLHPASDEVTLELRLALSDLKEGAKPGTGAAAAVRQHDVESGVRLRSGETFLMSGLAVGPFADDETSWLASRFDLPAGPGEVVLALTPRIVRGPGFSDSDLASICVGTETAIALCDHETDLRTALNE
jgi:type II secretory pathway component GspD/PulD (secretin)